MSTAQQLRFWGGKGETDSQATMLKGADEIERLTKTLSASIGYLLNAKIDLETSASKRTAIRTIEGGIKMIEAALNIHQRGGER